ncbi:hypothetical protein [Clostridium sp. HBUAS56010]|uniref:hypothetical protein n=1 Tax=Clostridium sp. HBUAS56010 TaxID=2571127 RepID=UPI00117807BA|nr:hypothetical protein [Clostridium sp. HBUAS56010]
MNTVTTIILCIAIIAIAMFVFSLYSKLLGTITQNSIRKRIAKGKINDKQLMNLYKASERGRRSKILAIFMYGIFYSSFLKMQEGTYLLYRDEMERRGLLEKAS